MSLDPLRPDLVPFLAEYLPTLRSGDDSRPFVTLTYAQSIDARISLGPGIRTAISDMETKVMTHYLRYHHAGILVGAGTALADDPGLNCKWPGRDEQGHTGAEVRRDEPLALHSPTPVIIDPSQKWRFTGSKMQQLFAAGEGKPPIVVVERLPEAPEKDVRYLVTCRDPATGQFDWPWLLGALKSQFQLDSVMVEGGACVINALLARPDVVDSLVVTVGSTYLGAGGVEVSPARPVKLSGVAWWRGKRDSIMAARLTQQSM